MCFGGSQPQAPQIVYQGPSQADIAANQAALDLYRSQMSAQQDTFATQLQQQIDAANSETSALQQRYENEAVSAAASSAAQQTSAYAVSATQSETPVSAQTTAATTKKKKPESNLRINFAGVPSSAGTGLNMGV